MHASIVELVSLVAIAFVWSRGTLFRWLRTLGTPPELRESHLTLPARAWVALADCPLCSGFWIGVLGHVIYLDEPRVIIWLGVGSIVGTCALGLCALVRRL